MCARHIFFYWPEKHFARTECRKQRIQADNPRNKTKKGENEWSWASRKKNKRKVFVCEIMLEWNVVWEIREDPMVWMHRAIMMSSYEHTKGFRTVFDAALVLLQEAHCFEWEKNRRQVAATEKGRQQTEGKIRHQCLHARRYSVHEFIWKLDLDVYIRENCLDAQMRFELLNKPLFDSDQIHCGPIVKAYTFHSNGEWLCKTLTDLHCAWNEKKNEL